MSPASNSAARFSFRMRCRRAFSSVDSLWPVSQIMVAPLPEIHGACRVLRHLQDGCPLPDAFRVFRPSIDMFPAPHPDTRMAFQEFLKLMSAADLQPHARRPGFVSFPQDFHLLRIVRLNLAAVTEEASLNVAILAVLFQWLPGSLPVGRDRRAERILGIPVPSRPQSPVVRPGART